MRRVIGAIVVIVALAGPGFTQEPDGAIPDVIQSQIEAFQADDFVTAFSFASPTIKRLFGTPDRFGLMVRQGYPMVWRPAEVTYLKQRAEGPVVYQDVLIMDGAGVPHVLEYQMIETPDGWQINGVRYIQPPAVGA